MDQTPAFASFDDFFPFYCGEHSRPLTRWLHFAGTHAGGAVLAAAVAARRPAWLLGAPAVAYGTAWAAHAVVERNRPATFSHPLWSLRGDLRMLGLMWRGHDAELQAIADEARAGTRQRPVVLTGALGAA